MTYCRIYRRNYITQLALEITQEDLKYVASQPIATATPKHKGRHLQFWLLSLSSKANKSAWQNSGLGQDFNFAKYFEKCVGV